MLAPLTLIAALLLGCTEQPLEPDIAWCDYTETALNPDEEALGTTPAALEAALNGLTEHPATWVSDGAATGATLDIALDTAQATLNESDTCGDAFVAIPATVTLSTDDGGLYGVVFDVDVRVYEGGVADLDGTIQPEDLAGTRTPDPLESNETRRGVTLSLQWTEGGAPSGDLFDEIEGEDEDTAWATSVQVLSIE